MLRTFTALTRHIQPNTKSREHMVHKLQGGFCGSKRVFCCNVSSWHVVFFVCTLVFTWNHGSS